MSKSGESFLRGARHALDHVRASRDGDALVAPEPGAWLALSEDERIGIVEEYHRRIRAPLPRARRSAHAIFHVIVEDNLASGEEPVVEAVLERLIGEGLDRHDAVHAVATVFAAPVNAAIRDSVDFSSEKCGKALEELTAASWLDGDWEG
ncbi:MAG TPA: hypothetical protein VHW66_22690 [Stellaceae bacterium]|jgi:hypothetical protein|nr:hypothetical protein [Stellaceae bacterium]